MRFLLIALSLFVLNACSSNSITAPVDREPASPLKSCTDIALNIISNDSRVIASKDYEVIKNYAEYIKFLKLETKNRAKLEPDDIKKLTSDSAYEFLSKLYIREDFEARLSLYISKDISQIPFENIITEILSEKMSYLGATGSIEQASRLLFDLGVPKIVSEKALLQTFLVKSGFISKLSIAEAMDLETHLVRLFKSQTKKIKSKDEFLKLLNGLENIQLNADEIKSILGESPYYKKIAEEDLKFTDVLDETLKGNVHIQADYLMKNLAIALDVFASNKIEQWSAFSRVNSSYSFFKAMEKILKENSKNQVVMIDTLTRSPFCKKMKLSDSDLNDAIVKIKEMNLSFVEGMKKAFPSYKRKKSFFTLDFYDQELEVVEVKNQCSWGSCWVHSSIEKIEMDILEEKKERIPLSTDYNFLKYLINEYKLSLLQKSLPREANFTQNFNLFAQEWGLVPIEAWGPKRPFANRDNAQILRDKLNKILKTYNKNPTIEKVQVRMLLKDIDKVVEEMFGPLPKVFTYKGREFTPQSFMEEYYPDIFAEKMSLVPEIFGNLDAVKIVQESTNVISKKNSINYTEFDFPSLEKQIIKSIDEKRAVVIEAKFPTGETYGNRRKYINERGYLTAPSEKTVLGKDIGSHAMLIVGYELDMNGKIKTLKILNSFGEGSGDKGFYHMDINYFRSFLNSITVRLEDGLGSIEFIPLDKKIMVSALSFQ